MKKLKLLIGFLLTINYSLLTINSFASIDMSLVAKAENYLNAITGLEGRFTQKANDRKDKGTFYMHRPGRVRLDYDTLTVQLISNGKDLFFYDSALDQITTVPLTSTPAGILVRKNIDLVNADIVVSETSSKGDSFSLRIHMKEQEGVGHMVVNFAKSPVALKSWVVVDATGQRVEVAFDTMKTRTNFPRGFFELQRHRTTANHGGDSFYD